MKGIKVSIIMITYGHEKYVRQAIESILMQKANFQIELIIANDHSPDNSDSIVKKAITKIPSHFKIKYSKHSQNKGSNLNFYWALQQCKGEYVAICEGDDYWTDENKLNKQVKFMDCNPDYSMYFHKSEDVMGKILQDFPSKQYTAKEILNNWYIHTASVLFRNNFTDEDYKILSSNKIYFYDIILFMIMENKGKIWGTNENMSFYRFVPSSITNKEKDIEYYKKILSHLEILASIYNKKYLIYIKDMVKDQAYKNFRYYATKLNPRAIIYFFKVLKYL